jgi:hypothetical protein
MPVTVTSSPYGLSHLPVGGESEVVRVRPSLIVAKSRWRSLTLVGQFSKSEMAPSAPKRESTIPQRTGLFSTLLGEDYNSAPEHIVERAYEST